MLNSLRQTVRGIPVIGPGLRVVQEKLGLADFKNRFLRKSVGVIHVGANTGQERELYEQYGVHVIWIEPIPEVFETLKTNLQTYPRQTAFQYLVTDQDGVEYEFHVSNNAGAASSILELRLHNIWPEVSFEKTISLRSTTLESFLTRERVTLGDYNALVMDTQGSELLVLKGAAPIVHMFDFIKTEVADFEVYANCCQLKDIDLFAREHGFEEMSRHVFTKTHAGNCYDIVYKRKVVARNPNHS